jgi:hypothetical protein
LITLSRSVGKGSVGGEPLPAPFASWAAKGIRFRRSSVSMLAGIPGSFKTMIMTNAVVNMRTPTLAFSTDSSIETVRARLLALASGQPTDDTEAWAYGQPDKAAVLLAQYDFMQYDFMPDPSLDDIWLSTYAYAEAHGVWPEQIVVDICSDVGHDTGDEWGSLRDLMRQSKVLARETGAHVLLVHHASDSQSTKRPCPRRSDIHGKVAAIPELIITCGMDDQGRLNVACVKNRHAKADKDANNYFEMSLAAERAYVGDHVNIPRSLAYGGGWGGEDGWDE